MSFAPARTPLPVERRMAAVRVPIPVLLATFIFSLLCPAKAHVGPPFPILVDQPVPGYLVTVWADPDVGEALFHVVVEPDRAGSGAAITAVDLWVEPMSGRLPRATHHAHRESDRRHLRFTARPEFDSPEPWRVGVEIHRADGTTHSLETQVEATPPGLGPWDLLIYGFPFVLFGGLWVFVFVRRMRARPAAQGNPSPSEARGHHDADAVVEQRAEAQTRAGP